MTTLRQPRETLLHALLAYLLKKLVVENLVVKKKSAVLKFHKNAELYFYALHCPNFILADVYE